jgi:hypothetical protein
MQVSNNIQPLNVCANGGGFSSSELVFLKSKKAQMLFKACVETLGS